MRRAPMVFVYLGSAVPDYARHALRFAAKRYPGEVILLTNAKNNLPIPHHFSVQEIDWWYDPTEFLNFRAHSSLDPDFRSGFWFHVVERFFVLKQFMSVSGTRALFHAELDVLILDIDGVQEACDSHGTGIFAVMDHPERALASLFYCNSAEKLNHFTGFALEHANMKNEMAMLGAYLQEHPINGHALPSDVYFDREIHPISPSGVPDEIGLFDANALGQWLFGVDPRNLRLASQTRYRNPVTSYPIEKLRFQTDFWGKRVFVELDGIGRRQLRSVHVHSKILGRLRFRAVFSAYLLLNRLPIRIPTTLRKGAISALILKASLKGKGLSIVRALSGLFPQLISFLLFKLASRSAIPPSLRELALLDALLDTRATRQNLRPANLLIIIDPSMGSSSDRAKIDSTFRKSGAKRLGLLISSESRGEAEKFYPDATVFELEKVLGAEFVLRGREHSADVADLRLQFEAAVALLAFRSNLESILFVRGNSAKVSEFPRCGGRNFQEVVFAPVKHQGAVLHAGSFWSHLSLRENLLGSDFVFVLQPDLVRQMFSQSEQAALEWVFSSGKFSHSRVSAAHSYFLWLVSTKPRKSRFISGRAPSAESFRRGGWGV